MPLSTLTDKNIDINEPVPDIETPALLLDLDQMERNMMDFVSFSNREGITLRSHAKAHKTPKIAHWQSKLTNAGIVCQKLSEAEVMVQNGIDDIYLSNIVVEKSKLERVVWLSGEIEYFATTVDGEESTDRLQSVASNLDSNVNVILEIDIGLNRLGVAPGLPAVELARHIIDQPNLALEGIMAYEGHIGYGSNGARTNDEYHRRCHEAMDTVENTVDLMDDDGIDISEVMVGSTATSKYSGRHPVVTEIHPGMYPFFDAKLVECMPEVTKPDCAATILTTVISKPTKDRIIVDAGSKSFSFDLDIMPDAQNRGDLRYYNASEEHGWVDISNSKNPPMIGDKIEFIMPHICTTVNLHDTIVGVRDGAVTNLWDIQARGKVK